MRLWPPAAPCQSQAPADTAQVAELAPRVSYTMALTLFQQGAYSAINHC